MAEPGSRTDLCRAKALRAGGPPAVAASLPEVPAPPQARAVQTPPTQEVPTKQMSAAVHGCPSKTLGLQVPNPASCPASAGVSQEPRHDTVVSPLGGVQEPPAFATVIGWQSELLESHRAPALVGSQ